MKKKVLISLLIGFAASFTGIYFSFKNVPFSDLYIYLKSINYMWIFPSVAVVILSFVARALRWQIILTSFREIGFKQAFHPLMIGFMINCILPGRVGEIARPAMTKKNTGIPFSTGIATIAAERVFDMVMLLGLFAWTITTIDFNSEATIKFGDFKLNRAVFESIGITMIKLNLLIIIGVLLISIKTLRNFSFKLIMNVPSFFFFLTENGKKIVIKKFCAPAVDFLENISIGFSLIKYPVKILSCVALSIAVWCLQAYSYYIVSLGCPGISLSYMNIVAVMTIICFFIALPSVPGYWGLWEAGGVFALALFGISSKDAAGYTLINHAVQVFPVILVGLLSSVSVSVNIWQISYRENLLASPVQGKGEE